MELPPKALQALVDIKKELLNREPDEPDSQFRENLKNSPNKAQRQMRHARSMLSSAVASGTRFGARYTKCQ